MELFSFGENPFGDWCEGLRITQKSTSIAHRDINGLIEVTNRTNFDGLKKRLEYTWGWWVKELSNVLYAYTTIIITTTLDTPFILVYGSKAVIPPKVFMPHRRLIIQKLRKMKKTSEPTWIYSVKENRYTPSDKHTIATKKTTTSRGSKTALSE